MIVYPALDLRGGKVVQLKQGDLAKEKIYGDDPIAAADRWIEAGAEWLHIINLDGAFSTEGGKGRENEKVITSLVARNVPIQFGGGLRSLNDVRRVFDMGVSRVILGTVAVEQPDIVAAVVDYWGANAVAVALDSVNNQVTIRGWKNPSGISPGELGRRLVAQGAKIALYTDVNRDGTLTGVNVSSTVGLAELTGMDVIASGGVSSLDNIVALRDSHKVVGVIIGTALYEGLIDLAKAIRMARG